MSLHEYTITELVAGLTAGDYSSVEVTRHYLDRITSLDDSINAYITPTCEQAMAAAAAADAARSNGDDRPLLGIPIAHKDIFLTSGVRTTAASRMLDNFVPPFDATVVQNLSDA